jgi:hypothetical protein
MRVRGAYKGVKIAAGPCHLENPTGVPAAPASTAYSTQYQQVLWVVLVASWYKHGLLSLATTFSYILQYSSGFLRIPTMALNTISAGFSGRVFSPETAEYEG